MVKNCLLVTLLPSLMRAAQRLTTSNGKEPIAEKMRVELLVPAQRLTTSNGKEQRWLNVLIHQVF
ncbi:MAG: hypothetical protein V7K20_08360 [Nostoc sp.]